MKKAFINLVLICCIYLLQGCNFKDEYTTSPYANFEALWKIINENYCFFDYKQIDWDRIHEEYSENIYDDMDEDYLFLTLSEMLYELQDGHVNLFTGNRVSSYEEWQHNDSHYFNIYSITYLYMNNNYSFFINNEDEKIVIYKAIEKGTIGYLHYSTFKEGILEKDLDQIFSRFEKCSAIIIDIRDNTGGSLTNSDRLASRFFHRKTLTSYIQHKTGKGRNDFSDPHPIYIEPSHSTIWPENKPVIILTNHKCYSAANNFVCKMNVLKNVTTIGTRTGGGSGFPFTSELPNGWGVRFSTSPILDINKQQTEFGIQPDITVEREEEGEEDEEYDYRDPVLDRAITFIQTGK